jgi:hypothetical protein
VGAPNDSRTESGCFSLTNPADPSSLGEIRLEEFLAMLRFERRHKLAELGDQEIWGKRAAQ